MPSVRLERVNAKSHHFDRLGRGTVVKRTARHGDTPINDTAHSRRRVQMDDYEWGDLIDQQDKIRMLIDPTSDYAKAAAWDLGIELDKIIIDALNGNAAAIDADDASSSVALPSSQIVDEDFGTADSNLTVEKLREARKIIMAHAGSIREKLYCVVNASAMDSLLAETEVTSSDFNTVKALVQGDVNSFLGMNFLAVKDGLLPGTADGTDTDPIKCLVYSESSLGLAMGKDISVKIAERVDKAFATQVYACMTAGAVRIEEEKVVAIECVQS